MGATLEGIALSSGDHWVEFTGENTRSGEEDADDKGQGQITAIYNLLVSGLAAYVSKTEALVVKLDALRKELQQEMARRQQCETRLLELQGSSDIHSSRLQEASVEVELSRTGLEMLSELQLIETSSRVKGLLSRIQELQSEHALEIAELRAESGDLESKMREGFENEYVAQQQWYESKVSALEAQLKSEQARRQSCQAELVEEREHQLRDIRVLEEAKLEMTKKFNELEIEHAKLKLELHTDVSLV
jgi:hypothetical protein